MVKAYNLKQESEVKLKEAESEEKLRLAYLQAAWTARFVWSTRLPSFDQLINKKEEKKVMAPGEILEEVKRLNLALGGKVY